NVGIDFRMSGLGFDDANGNPYQIPAKYDSVTHALKDPTGYTLTNSSPNYTTKIQWALPDKTDPRWVNGATYTLSLKAFDTDQNKPGNDCGQAARVPVGSCTCL